LPETKTVQLKSSTKKRLDSLGTKGDTYDRIIRRLIAFFESSNGAVSGLNNNGRALMANNLGNSGRMFFNGGIKKNNSNNTAKKPLKQVQATETQVAIATAKGGNET